LYNGVVIRFLAFAGAVALALSQPAVALAEPAPPGAIAMPMPAAPMPIYGGPVFHAAPMPVYHPAPRPAPAARPVMSSPDLFKVPFDVNVHPGPLHGTIAHPAFQPALQPNPLLIPRRQFNGFFWPTNFVNTPCYSGNGFWGPWGMLATPTFSLGSDTYTASQQVDPSYGVDIGTLGGVYQQYAPAQPFCSPGFIGL
jgi:hypothetical protein